MSTRQRTRSDAALRLSEHEHDSEFELEHESAHEPASAPIEQSYPPVPYPAPPALPPPVVPITDLLLAELCDPTRTLVSIARDLKISIAELVRVARDPEFNDQLESLRFLAAQQTRLMASMSMPRATGTLARFIHGFDVDIEELRKSEGDLLFSNPTLFLRWQDVLRKSVHLLARLTAPVRARTPSAQPDRASRSAEPGTSAADNEQTESINVSQKISVALPQSPFPRAWQYTDLAVPSGLVPPKPAPKPASRPAPKPLAEPAPPALHALHVPQALDAPVIAHTESPQVARSDAPPITQTEAPQVTRADAQHGEPRVPISDWRDPQAPLCPTNPDRVRAHFASFQPPIANAELIDEPPVPPNTHADDIRRQPLFRPVWTGKGPPPTDFDLLERIAKLTPNHTAPSDAINNDRLSPSRSPRDAP